MEPATAAASTESAATAEAGVSYAGKSVIALHSRFAAVLDSSESAVIAFGGAR
jgi:hypothetical protein